MLSGSRVGYLCITTDVIVWVLHLTRLHIKIVLDRAELAWYIETTFYTTIWSINDDTEIVIAIEG